MSRQTQINTFNDGLNKDTNALLTPNTVMTDCLNGTIVTYNGNEFALQNDLGNYKFKYGSLNLGYVPVGIKEHGNILYIVSYNPIDDKVQIGSFPSMKTITASDIKTSGNPSKIEIDDGWNLYSDLSNNSQLVMLSDISEDYKINPGDKYILERYDDDDTSLQSYDWQHESLYILTDNNKLYNIDGYVMPPRDIESNKNTYNSSDFEYVKWDIPGYMAVKTIVDVMSEFNCYITDFGNSDIEIKLQSIWDKSYFNKFIDNNKLKDNVIFGYKYIIYDSTESSPEIKTDEEWFEGWEDYNEELNIYNYNDLIFSLYTNIYVNKFSSVGNMIKIVPYRKLDEDHYIVYDQFITELSLEKSNFSNESVNSGTGEFYYTVSNDKLTLTLDINSTPDVELAYQFIRYNPYWKEGEELKEYPVYKTPMPFTDVNYSGQNIIPIPFANDSQGDVYFEIPKKAEEDKPESDNTNNENIETLESNEQENADESEKLYNYFDKEDIYKLIIYIYPSEYKLKDDEISLDLTDEQFNEEYSYIYRKTYDLNIYATEIINDFRSSGINMYTSDSPSISDIVELAKTKIKVSKYNIDKGEDGEYIGNNIYYINNENVTVDEENPFDNQFYLALKNTNLKRWTDDKTIYDVTTIAEYGTEYKIIFDEDLLLFPKHQNGKDVGRMWKGINKDSILINLTSNNDVNIKKRDDEYYVNSIYHFSAKPNYESYIGENAKTVAREEDIKHMFDINSCVTKPSEDGWFTLDRILCYFEGAGDLSNDNKGEQGISWLKPRYNIKFKVISGEEVIIKIIADIEYVFEFEYSSSEDIWDLRNNYDIGIGGIKDLYQLFWFYFVFYESEVIQKDHKFTTNRNDFNNMLVKPGLTLFYNNDSRDNYPYYKIGGDFYGIAQPRLFNIEDTLTSNRQMFEIAFKNSSNKYDTKCFIYKPKNTRLLNSRKHSSNGTYAHDYVAYILLTYMTMVAGIKVSGEVKTKDLYKLNSPSDGNFGYDIQISGNNNCELNSISYSINLDINYDGNKFSELYKSLSNSTYVYEDKESKFSLKNNVEYIDLKLLVHKYNKSIPNYNIESVNQNEAYVLMEYLNKPGQIKNIANIMGNNMDINKNKVSDKYIDFRIREGSGNNDKDYSDICTIYGD